MRFVLNRSEEPMSDPKLGQLIDSTAQRDAVHVAIAPVVAAERLEPGAHVGLHPDGRAGKSAGEPIGIVDPYLPLPVAAGQWFYLCLYPGSVTGMRHHWKHPSFRYRGAVPDMDEQKAFLAEIALNPDDETPHRIYADWLEEHGELDEAEKHRQWTTRRHRAEQWLRNYALEIRPYDDADPEKCYQLFLADAQNGDIYFHGVDTDSPPHELFEHLSIVLGREVGRGDFEYSCSC
jgi:uncharacterized protein (TIGR02996 family)